MTMCGISINSVRPSFSGYQLEYRIKFFACGKQVNHDHPTGTLRHPDFVAVMQDRSVPVDSVDDPEKSQAASKFCWSQVEATGENKSKGKSKNSARLQAASYTGYLLQPRPDLVSVLGILVDPKEFTLLLTNACGVYSIKPVTWESLDAANLLCAWIDRLYHPEVDASITRLYKSEPDRIPAPAPAPAPAPTLIASFPSKPTFMIRNMNGKQFMDCKIIKAGSPFHRRTTIFQTNEGKVVKEQYIELTRRHEEGLILEQIHKNGHFPGVVQYESYDVVKRVSLENMSDEPGSVQSECPATELIAVCGDEKRKKTRLVMSERASLLMDVETPWEVLILAYDLLEVIRHLYTKRKILHRDISVNNVLCRSEYFEMDPPSDFAKDKSKMCFAAHLLGDKEPEAKAGVGPLATRLMLIDYDMSQDCTKKSAEQEEKQSTSQTGTFIFMACSVRSGQISEGFHFFPPMPQLDPFFETRYEACVPGRLKAFSPNTQHFHHESQTKDIKPFRHKLAYDTESLFWVLLYYFMQAQPVSVPGEEQVKEPLLRECWNNFVGGNNDVDTRPNHFIGMSFPHHLFHSSYKDFDPLFEGMANQLRGDPEVLGVTDRTKEEYLVEAFQRLILNFLFKFHDQKFMHIKKDPNPRELTPYIHWE